jgi:hypothetical protein
MKDKGGRPTKFSQELADKICERVVEGKSLIKISKELNFNIASFFRWLREEKDFCDKYTRAKVEQADTLIEEILDIADCTKFDKTIDENGKIITDHEHITRSRLRVDTRKWIAGKMRPKKYGEKLILDEDSKKLLAPTIILKNE